ncbi:MAG: hypothetical protein K8S13_06065 [Desulfobacula sp.]|uniref:hypothetical protein n=1 Tax=Desulfobacula sp. TaxID=2593537 RepID=UPI0025B837FB|nr:hypothetical protein [Desulfobacula sp.]MCD4719409.1 hypothetical protein [Desulfobacula sp.]
MQTIALLKQKNSKTISNSTEITAVEKPEPKKEINLVEEIISRFKKGEVNLPTLPEISIQFNDLVKRGANIDEVAYFLKKAL